MKFFRINILVCTDDGRSCISCCSFNGRKISLTSHISIWILICLIDIQLLQNILIKTFNFRVFVLKSSSCSSEITNIYHFSLCIDINLRFFFFLRFNLFCVFGLLFFLLIFFFRFLYSLVFLFQRFWTFFVFFFSFFWLLGLRNWFILLVLFFFRVIFAFCHSHFSRSIRSCRRRFFLLSLFFNLFV